jgi:hypothetical protein
MNEINVERVASEFVQHTDGRKLYFGHLTLRFFFIVDCLISRAAYLFVLLSNV